MDLVVFGGNSKLKDLHKSDLLQMVCWFNKSSQIEDKQT